MQNTKLQELTEKLYQEGLAKGKKEGDEKLVAAKKEAQRILDEAKAEAQNIVDKAKKDAQEAGKNAEAEIRMAFRQSFLTVRQQIEQMIVTKAISEPVRNTVNDELFIQEVIRKVVSGFNPKADGSVALSVLLPAAMQEKMEKQSSAAVQTALGAGVEVKFDKQVKAGFKIGPKDQGYFISFTDKDFENLIREYLRPHLAALLFGGN